MLRFIRTCALQSSWTDQALAVWRWFKRPARRRGAGRPLTPQCALQPSLLARRCSEVRRRPALLVRGPRPSPNGGRPLPVRQTAERRSGGAYSVEPSATTPTWPRFDALVRAFQQSLRKTLEEECW